MTFKVKILLFSTFDFKNMERPKISLWPFSKFFGLTYQPLNSDDCRKGTLSLLQGILALCEFHYCDFSKLSKYLANAMFGPKYFITAIFMI